MIKEILKYFFYKSAGLFGLYGRRRSHLDDKIVILTYHGVLPFIPKENKGFEYRNFATINQFEQQIRFLLRHYHPISIDDLLKPNQGVKNGFLITFDDGYKNNVQFALPILNKYGIRACFLIVTGLVGSRKFLWTDHITRLIMRTEKGKLNINIERDGGFHLNGRINRELASQKIRTYLKRVHPLDRNQLIREMENQLSDVGTELESCDEDRYLMMDWDDVRTLVNSGHTVGTHSHSHPILTTLAPEESYRELKVSKEMIEKQTGIECTTFSYPNGELPDFKDLHQNQIKELGYQLAFSQIPLFNDNDTNRYVLRRINICKSMSLPVFEATICGFKK